MYQNQKKSTLRRLFDKFVEGVGTCLSCAVVGAAIGFGIKAGCNLADAAAEALDDYLDPIDLDDDDLDEDEDDDEVKVRYPHLKDNGAYSEWAWGFSRLLDGLELLGPEVTKIDMKHIGVTGCSYAGKMALYCGAFDERVALTIAQEPGGGGAAAWRISHLQNDVENIDRTDYHWFLESQLENFCGDSVYQLPYDQHELCALVCPRALLLLGNPDYKWLADDAMLVSAQAPYGLEYRRRSWTLSAA